MDINLPETVINDITEFSEKHNIKKVILFGSRAKKAILREAMWILLYAAEIILAFITILTRMHIHF